MQGASRASLAGLVDDLVAGGRTVGDPAVAAGLADELFAVADVVDTQAPLRRALVDPAVPADRRAGLVDAVFAGKVSAVAADVLRAVAAATWSRPRDVADALEVLATQAAFNAAELAGRLDEIEDELFRFGRIVEGEPPLRAALTDPALPDERKRALLDALLADRASETTLELLTQIVLHPRGRTFERALDELTRLAAQRRERLLANVTSAVPLDADQQQRLAAALGRVYGTDVQLQLEVDPELRGGVVVRIRDEIIDASVARRLEQARRRLAG